MHHKKYKQIWKLFYGKIPRDENGMLFEIHHIDGDRTNNSILNLVALSIQDHYDVHHIQGDHYACFLIAKRLNLTKEERSKLAKLASEKCIKDGKHPWKDSDKQRELSLRQIERGTHSFLGSKMERKWIKNMNVNKLECPVCKKSMNLGNYTKYNHGNQCKQKEA